MGPDTPTLILPTACRQKEKYNVVSSCERVPTRQRADGLKYNHVPSSSAVCPLVRTSLVIPGLILLGNVLGRRLQGPHVPERIEAKALRQGCLVGPEFGHAQKQTGAGEVLGAARRVIVALLLFLFFLAMPEVGNGGGNATFQGGSLEG
jgi:hypothetical protein